ncbi:hypothetical protein ACFFQW_22565 [Umezawaea endophytica]|uniref:Uncharacterized protein n=1 Tax=Umezawaea endophytica TaxID=1654476 RepID=A0A9X3A0U3_9PSEU|nr:hypothetical protein [Umezawaea endophytica]MCS7477313.1 hypothetical protein [Umezawaea endophytica]
MSPLPPRRNALPNADMGHALTWYRDQMGWDVRLVDGVPTLSLTHGMTGFLFPRAWFAPVASLMSTMDVQGPVIGFLDEVESKAVALADTNDCVFSQAQMPPGVTLLRTPGLVPLPPKIGSSWLIEPHNERRWLPSATAVLSVLQAAQSPARPPRTPRTLPYRQLQAARR